MRFGRPTLGVAGALLAILGLISGGVVPASAVPTTIEQAKAALEAIEAEASAVDQQYAALQFRQAEDQARLERARADIAKQNEKLAELRSRVAQVALADWRGHGIDTTTALMTSEDVDAFLNQLSTVQQVTNNANSLIAEFEVERANLADIERSAQADEAAIAKDRAAMAELKQASDAKLAEAEAVLNRLTADQRSQLRAQRSSLSRGAATRPAAAASGSASSRALAAVAFAEKQVGKTYVMGGTGPNSYDCSGLTMVAYRYAGISIPRTSQEQFRVGKAVSISDLQPGDLVFYYSSVSHVGIYVGDGQIVHAANPYTDVVYAPVGLMRIAGARRVA